MLVPLLCLSRYLLLSIDFPAFYFFIFLITSHERKSSKEEGENAVTSHLSPLLVLSRNLDCGESSSDDIKWQGNPQVDI